MKYAERARQILEIIDREEKGPDDRRELIGVCVYTLAEALDCLERIAFAAEHIADRTVLR